MTTIKDRHTELSIEPHKEGGVYVRLRHDDHAVGFYGIFPKADILDAIGAVPNADMAREIAEAQREANEWKARAEKAEAIIEKVRAWVDSEDQFDALDAILNPEDTEALDSEAQRLYSASHVASVGYKGYYELGEGAKDIWRSVARKAREVYGAES